MTNEHTQAKSRCEHSNITVEPGEYCQSCRVTKAPEQAKDWEVEFDRRFVQKEEIIYQGGPAIGNAPRTGVSKRLKQDLVGLHDFITQLLAERDAETETRVRAEAIRECLKLLDQLDCNVISMDAAIKALTDKLKGV